jgi:hypothetical protein
MDDFSGIDVSVEGFGTHAKTDASGAWTLNGVPPGTRDITLSKTNFATMHVPQFSVTAPATDAGLVTLAQTPFQQALIDSVYVVTRATGDVYFVDGHLSAPPPANSKLGGTVALFGKANSVSTDVGSFAIWGNGIDATGKSSTFSISLTANVVRAAFALGDHVYVTAYAVSAICGCYTDPVTKHPVLTTAGPRSNVVTITVK